MLASKTDFLLLSLVTARASKPATFMTETNCSPKRFRAVTIIINFPLLNNNGIRKHNVFPEPVTAVAMMSLLLSRAWSWARHKLIWNRQGVVPKTFCVVSLISLVDGSTSLSVVSVINKGHVSVFEERDSQHVPDGELVCDFFKICKHQLISLNVFCQSSLDALPTLKLQSHDLKFR